MLNPLKTVEGRTDFPRWSLVCIALSLCGAIWASIVGTECADCRAAGAMLHFGYLNLAIIGSVFYALLLGAMCAKGMNVWTLRGIFIAAGVHLILLVVLLRQRLLCPPCLITALGAFAAAGLAWAHGKATGASNAAFALPLAAVLTLVAVVSEQQIAVRKNERLVRDLIVNLRKEPETTEGETRLIIYTRPHCPFCTKLKSDVLPRALAQVQKVHVEERDAPKNLPTPTLIILGSQNSHFLGLPKQEDLVDSLRRAR